jgi:hypothetical protein
MMDAPCGGGGLGTVARGLRELESAACHWSANWISNSGSKDQKHPLPRSSGLRSILIKALCEERVCRVEFCCSEQQLDQRLSSKIELVKNEPKDKWARN